MHMDIAAAQSKNNVASRTDRQGCRVVYSPDFGAYKMQRGQARYLHCNEYFGYDDWLPA